MIKLEYRWKGIPGHLVNGRWISTPYGWEKVKALVKELAGGRCENCGAYTPFGDTHHIYGRGAAKREDRWEVNGRRMLRYLCRTCHDATRILRRPPASMSTTA